MTQVYHAQTFGYVLVEVDDLKVTTTWLERQSNNVAPPGVYQPQDIWTYTVAGCAVQLVADLNQDCRVDFADLAILAFHWLLGTGPTANPPANAKQ